MVPSIKASSRWLGKIGTYFKNLSHKLTLSYAQIPSNQAKESHDKHQQNKNRIQRSYPSPEINSQNPYYVVQKTKTDLQNT